MSTDGWRPDNGEPGTGGRASWQGGGWHPGGADRGAGPAGQADPGDAGQARYGSPIPPYASGPQDDAQGWGAPAPYGQPAQGPAPYGQAPYGPSEHPKAQSLRTMGIASIPLAMFCNVIGIVLALVVLGQVGGVNREIVAGNMIGLDKTKQARTFAIIGLVLGFLGGIGNIARMVNSWW